MTHVLGDNVVASIAEAANDRSSIKDTDTRALADSHKALRSILADRDAEIARLRKALEMVVRSTIDRTSLDIFTLAHVRARVIAALASDAELDAALAPASDAEEPSE